MTSATIAADDVKLTRILFLSSKAGIIACSHSAFARMSVNTLTLFASLRHGCRHLVIRAIEHGCHPWMRHQLRRSTRSQMQNITRLSSPLILDLRKKCPPFSPSHHRQLLAFRLVLFYFFGYYYLLLSNSEAFTTHLD
uniref:Uncharacterized protein n=1 Tax=Rhipicephalus microplus TaxID=6941 RepID=A0A6G5AGK5_RHIMP